MAPVKALALLLACVGLAQASLLNGMAQRTWDASGHPVAYSLGLGVRSKYPWLYYEGGLLFKPGREAVRSEHVLDFQFEERRPRTILGTYAGFHVPIFPIFRPGIYLGTLLVRDEIRRGTDGASFTRSGYAPFEFRPYFGLSVQAGILSFVISNIGMGGGINVAF